jgi:hypothetical protein
MSSTTTPPIQPAYEVPQSDKMSNDQMGNKDQEAGDSKVEEVDMSSYSFTPEESRSISKKFDWHVSGPVSAIGIQLTPQILPIIWCK